MPRFVYSVIRYVPDSARGEYVNIGLIVGSDDTHEWALRPVDDRSRAEQLGKPELVPEVFRYLEWLAVEIREQPSPVEEGWLRYLEWQRGLVQFSAPLPAYGENAVAVINMLWAVLVTDVRTERIEHPGPIREFFVAEQPLRRTPEV